MPNAWNKTHLTASAVVAPTPPGVAGATASGSMILHAVSINGAAATAVINIYDYNSTTTPPASALIASITIPTAPVVPAAIELDCICTVGITITIATAAADVTVLWL